MAHIFSLKNPIVLLSLSILMIAYSGAAIGEGYSEDLIGIDVQDLEGDLANYFKIPKGEAGILITKVLVETPAEKADLQVGDVIISVADKNIDSVETWLNIVPDVVAPEKKLSLAIIRDGKKKSVTLDIPKFIEVDRQKKRCYIGKDDFHKFPLPLQMMNPGMWAPPRNYLGVVLHDLQPETRESSGYQGPNGVYIHNVIEGTPAEKAGLKTGDVIITINGTPAESPSHARQLIVDAEKEATLTLTIFRDGKEHTLQAPLEFREGEGYMKYVLPFKDSWREFRDDFDENIKPELKQDIEELRQQMLNLKEEMKQLREEIQRNEAFAD